MFSIYHAVDFRELYHVFSFRCGYDMVYAPCLKLG